MFTSVSHHIVDQDPIVQRRQWNSEDSSPDFGDVNEGDSNSKEMNYRIRDGAPGWFWRASARGIEIAGRLRNEHAMAMYADIAELTTER